MGFWQNLADSYDRNTDALKSRYPISTTTISNIGDIIAVITIDENGTFIKSEEIEKAKKNKNGEDAVLLCIPVTEKSLGRSGKKAWENPNPIFDQYEYLKGEGNHFESYIAGLEKFACSEFSTPQVKAIYKYVIKRTVSMDLAAIVPKDKTYIVFRVEIPGNPQANLWEDETLFSVWNDYYIELKGEATELDYLTGQEQVLAISHPKKIINKAANAKLISDNDTSDFTFRGKFDDSAQAVSIGYFASQKAHQFLRYLINDRGYYCGEQVILSFTIGSTEKSLPPPLDDTKSIFDFESFHQNIDTNLTIYQTIIACALCLNLLILDINNPPRRQA